MYALGVPCNTLQRPFLPLLLDLAAWLVEGLGCKGDSHGRGLREQELGDGIQGIVDLSVEKDRSQDRLQQSRL